LVITKYKEPILAETCIEINIGI